MDLNLKHRKYSIQTSTDVIINDSDTLFDEISKVYGLSYLGIYKFGDEIRIYLNLNNAIKIGNIKMFFESMSIDVLSICSYKKLIGDVVSQKGHIFMNGGSRVTTHKPNKKIKKPTIRKIIFFKLYIENMCELIKKL